MIKKILDLPYDVILYTIECDHCGKNLMENNGLYGFDNTEEIEIEAEYNDWSEKNGCHYCPDCQQLKSCDGYDEDSDPKVAKNTLAEMNHDYETACR